MRAKAKSPILTFSGTEGKNTSAFVDEDVGRLEVAVDDAFHVAVGDSGEHLVEELLDPQRLHPLVAQTLQVVFQVLVQKLENEVELFLVDDHILQST